MFCFQNISLESRFLRTGLLRTASYLCNPLLHSAPFPLEWTSRVWEEGVGKEGVSEK